MLPKTWLGPEGERRTQKGEGCCKGAGGPCKANRIFILAFAQGGEGRRGERETMWDGSGFFLLLVRVVRVSGSGHVKKAPPFGCALCKPQVLAFTRMPPTSFHQSWQLLCQPRTLKFVTRHLFQSICSEKSILSITFTFWENRGDNWWGPNQI